jgi:hypothetical protein
LPAAAIGHGFIPNAVLRKRAVLLLRPLQRGCDRDELNSSAFSSVSRSLHTPRSPSRRAKDTRRSFQRSRAVEPESRRHAVRPGRPPGARPNPQGRPSPRARERSASRVRCSRSNAGASAASVDQSTPRSRARSANPSDPYATREDAASTVEHSNLVFALDHRHQRDRDGRREDRRDVVAPERRLKAVDANPYRLSRSRGLNCEGSDVFAPFRLVLDRDAFEIDDDPADRRRERCFQSLAVAGADEEQRTHRLHSVPEVGVVRHRVVRARRSQLRGRPDGSAITSSTCSRRENTRSSRYRVPPAWT